MRGGDAPSTRPVLASLAGCRQGWIGRDVAAGLAALHAEVAGLLAAPGQDMIFDDLDDALRAFDALDANTGGNP